MSKTIQDRFRLDSEDVRRFVLGLLTGAPLVDSRGRVLEVMLTRRRPHGSQEEESKRRLMHKFLHILADDRGYTPDEMRFEMRRRFLPLVPTLQPDGRYLDEPMSTNDLSDTSQPTLSHFISELQRFAAEECEGLQLRSNREPDPDLGHPTKPQRFNGEPL